MKAIYFRHLLTIFLTCTTALSAHAAISITKISVQAAQGVAGVSAKRISAEELLAPLNVNGSASGFIIDSSGHVATLSSAISDSGSMEVILENAEAWPAVVTGMDRQTGIAIIKIQAPENRLNSLLPLERAIETPAAGTTVFAAGRHADGNIILAKGIVSSPDRTIASAEKIYDSAIQTDINPLPCMAGAPLMNGNAQVVGMLFPLPDNPDSAYQTSFAIPVDTIIWVAKQIIEKGVVERAWLGATFAPVTPSEANALDLPASSGLMVTSVTPSGPAAKAGIRPCTKNIRIGNRIFPIKGDIIVAANGHEIHTYRDLQKILRATEPGKNIIFSLYRGEIYRKIRIKTGVLGPDGKGRLH